MKASENHVEIGPLQRRVVDIDGVSPLLVAFSQFCVRLAVKFLCIEIFRSRDSCGMDGNDEIDR